VSLLKIAQVFDKFSFPKAFRQSFRRHKKALLIFCVGAVVIVLILPISSRVHLVLTDWEEMSLGELRISDPKSSFYSVLGQVYGFVPLQQRAQWVFVSTKDNTLDLTVLQPNGNVGGPIALDVSRVDLDISPRLWYLIPKFERDKMRREPRLVYRGQISPGSMKINAPSLLCWLYGERQGTENASVIWALHAPLRTTLTVQKERGPLENAKPPLSKESPSNNTFTIRAGDELMGFIMVNAFGQINIFCHGGNAEKQAPIPIQINAPGLNKAIIIEAQAAPADPDAKRYWLPGFLVRLGKQDQRLEIATERSVVTFTVATPTFNLGRFGISEFSGKGLRGRLKIDSDSMILDGGDEVSIGGQDLKVSTGDRGEIIVEGNATKILQNGIVESKRMWSLIPSDLRTILISMGLRSI
jgi:hypothetical protein